MKENKINKFRFFRRLYNSITGKNYSEMVNQTSWYAIYYLAIFELIFTIIISILAIPTFVYSSFIDIYNYIMSFLANFFYNAISMTLDTILILSVCAYLYQILRKDKKSYSKLFCLATYSSTLAMILKYIVLIYSYTQGLVIEYFKYIYIAISLLYFLLNYRKSFDNCKIN